MSTHQPDDVEQSKMMVFSIQNQKKSDTDTIGDIFKQFGIYRRRGDFDYGKLLNPVTDGFDYFLMTRYFPDEIRKSLTDAGCSITEISLSGDHNHFPSDFRIRIEKAIDHNKRLDLLHK